MVFFIETKLGRQQMERVRRICGYTNGIEVDSEGSRGGLCLAWRNEVDISLSSFSKRHIDVLVDDNEKGCKWRFTGFYGSPYTQDRSESWAVLKSLATNKDLSWFVVGDFNEIMYGIEKKGGLPRDERRIELFRRVLEECQLHDVGYEGSWFTWERGNLPETNIRERLDRGVENAAWINLFQAVRVQHLVHSMSDHYPLLINTRRYDERRSYSFKFEAWWSLEECFENEVRSLWENASGELIQKLDFLKNGLQMWAKQIQKERKKTKQILMRKLTELAEEERDDKTL
ncbi:hypothetical protein Goklo_023940, partial [Gossypium klotzschianum]|nr:hypothetical protein [Gossypium klotzschianum]